MWWLGLVVMILAVVVAGGVVVAGVCRYCECL